MYASGPKGELAACKTLASKSRAGADQFAPTDAAQRPQTKRDRHSSTATTCAEGASDRRAALPAQWAAISLLCLLASKS